jgi:hypothetical protein
MRMLISKSIQDFRVRYSGTFYISYVVCVCACVQDRPSEGNFIL